MLYKDNYTIKNISKIIKERKIKMFIKKILMAILVLIAFAITSTKLYAQPSICWDNLVLKPSGLLVNNTEQGYSEITGTIVYFSNVGYFQKLPNNEWKYYDRMAGKGFYNNLTVYLGENTNLTIYAKNMKTVTAMGFLNCYDLNRAKEILQEQYPGYLNSDNTVYDTLTGRDFLLYMGDKNFPKWDYLDVDGKIVLIYNIATGETVLKFIDIAHSGKPFVLPQIIEP